MKTLLDTSAVVPFLDRTDPDHERCVDAVVSVEPDDLVTHSYLVSEGIAVVQRRLGLAAAKSALRDLFSAMHVHWIDEALHAESVRMFLSQSRSRLSFCDQTSFALMRREGITRAIALDRDFARAGFEVLPS